MFLKVMMLIRQAHLSLLQFFSIDINSITILNIHGVDYQCSVAGVSKSKALSRLKTSNLSKKCIVIKYKTFLSCIKDK